MGGTKNHLTGIKKYLLSTLALLVVVALVVFITGKTQAARFGPRSLQIGSSIVSATTNYDISFIISTTYNIGSVSLLFCSNTPLITDPCTVPVGLDISNASVSVQNMNNLTVTNKTANSLLLSRTAYTLAAGTDVKISLSGVKNPSQTGTYYMRAQTFNSSDGSGADTDEGGFTFAMVDGLQLTTKVPPYLAFCTGITINSTNCSTATGDYINFGDATSTSTQAASSQFVVATNGDGFVIQVNGITLTSGNNIIPSLPVPDISRPGTSQFGLNLRANSDPIVGADPSGPGLAVPLANYDVPNEFVFVPGDKLVSATTSEDYRKFTVSYMVNVAKDQPSGVYASTLNYVCSGNF